MAADLSDIWRGVWEESGKRGLVDAQRIANPGVIPQVIAFPWLVLGLLVIFGAPRHSRGWKVSGKPPTPKTPQYGLLGLNLPKWCVARVGHAGSSTC